MRVHSTLHDDTIRDRIVVGIKSSSLSARMQLDDALTLEKATKTVRQSETVKLQQLEMRRLPNERSLEAIKTGRKVYRTRSQVLAHRTPQFTGQKKMFVQDVGNLLLMGEICVLQETVSVTNVEKQDTFRPHV